MFLRKAELRMTQAMNPRMFFGVAWLLIGLAWEYRSLRRNKSASLRRSGYISAAGESRADFFVLLEMSRGGREIFLWRAQANENLDSLICCVCIKHPGPSPRVPGLPVPMAKVNYQGPQPRRRNARRAPNSKNLKHKPHKTPIPRAQTCALGPHLRTNL